MNAFDKYLNETMNMLNERSINKIQAEFTEVVNKMSAMAKEFAAAEGDEKTNILAELKGLTAKKNDLVKELDVAVAGKDKDIQLAIKENMDEAYGSSNPHAKPAGLTKDETMEVAQKFADAMSKADGTKVTVNKRTLEEDSFDLDIDGEEFDGGSYNIYQNGNVMNMALPSNPIYGKKNDSVATIAKNMKKAFESVVTEGKKLTLKRQYTENHPAITVGKNANVRNKVLEFIKDGRITKEAFEKFVSDISNRSKSWTKNNTRYFTISEDGVSLSKFGKKVLSQISVNEATKSNPHIWVPGQFDKEIGKHPISKITRELVLKAADKWDVDPSEAIPYVEFGWDLDLSENNTNNMKTKFIYESFQEFVENKLNEGNLNEAFASTKLASLLTGGAHMDKDLPNAFYNMSKLKLDQIQDVDIIEMDPLAAKKEKRANAVYFYFTTNEKENPYAGKSAWSDQKNIPANTLLAITDGSNEWMATGWQKSYSRDKNATRTLKVGKREDAAGFKKSGRGEYNSGISSMKQVSELADRAYVLDLDILKARYSATTQRDERAAAKKGAIAFQNDKDFKAENLARYREIIANKASKLPIDEIVKDAIETMSEQIKAALVKGEKGRYGDIIVGTSDKGKEAKLNDAAHHMKNILDDYQRYVNYVKQAEEEVKAGYGSSYYEREVKNYAQYVMAKVKQIEGFSYAW